MNENLFTFPGGTADASGDNPFDLSGFTELTGNNTQNPFADLLAGGEATEQPPAEGAGAVQADDSIPEEKDETDQNHETVEEDESHEIPNLRPLKIHSQNHLPRRKVRRTMPLISRRKRRTIPFLPLWSVKKKRPPQKWPNPSSPSFRCSPTMDRKRPSKTPSRHSMNSASPS